MLALALAIIAPSQLQADARLIRIGVLRPGSPPDPLAETFRQALGDLGYVEGRNLSLEVRWADGKDERLSGLAAELVRLKVDVIVAGGGVPLLAASQATSSGWSCSKKPSPSYRASRSYGILHTAKAAS
jgi:hypothetical protein